MRWKHFVQSWKDCTACPLHCNRNKIVLARGQLPCDVLFVGEAPGQSEDCFGQPFIGPAGRQLDVLVKAAYQNKLRIAFTNLLCCLPIEQIQDKERIRQPVKKEIEACSTRLAEFVQVAQPRLLVAVGQLAKSWLPRLLEFDTSGFCDIIHPSAILQSFVEARELMCEQVVIRLRDAWERIEE